MQVVGEIDTVPCRDNGLVLVQTFQRTSHVVDASRPDFLVKKRGGFERKAEVAVYSTSHTEQID